MNVRSILSCCCCLLLCACVQPPVFKGEGYALLNTNYPVVEINGEKVEPAYRLDIEAGDNTVVVAYHSYQIDYHCMFRWTAAADTVYEVTDQENLYPLTLYRWVRVSGLLAARLDPMDPLECSLNGGQ